MGRHVERMGRDRAAHTWAAACHASALSILLGVPFGLLIGPVLIWLLRRSHPFVDRAGRQAINFQLSVTIYGTALALSFWMIGAFTFAAGDIPLAFFPLFFPLLHGGVLV